jgi:TrmH family RNA methyltransferase
VLVLEGVQDAGNVGTLLRTAAAAGVDQVWLSAGCAHAWSPRVLRAGMGAQFVLSIAEGVDVLACLTGLEKDVIATSLDATESVFEAKLRGDAVWLFGAEGRGLSAELLARATRRLTIPMPGRVESLNVAAAAAICLFEQVRQRSVQHP